MNVMDTHLKNVWRPLSGPISLFLKLAVLFFFFLSNECKKKLYHYKRDL